MVSIMLFRSICTLTNVRSKAERCTLACIPQGMSPFIRQHPFEGTRVRIGQGIVVGKVLNRPFQGKYYSFQGVPYAQPPLGLLRFRAPLPPLPFDGERDACQEASICCQIDRSGAVCGSEDCLYLNVYTPTLRTHRPLPVMVWFHDGGFSTGSGNMDEFGPDYIINEEVVLVTVNFRLGALGYLSLETPEMSGNMGSKDQIAALKWIRENIKEFGGNPQSVTLFGIGSGAEMIHAILLSPMGIGLYHRVILQSGTIANPAVFVDDPRERTVELAKILGKETVDPSELSLFLRKISTADLVKASNHVLPLLDRKLHKSVPFGLVSEISHYNNIPFITRKPSFLLRSGKVTSVPMMIGYTQHEGLEYLKDAMDVLDNIEDDFEILLPDKLELEKKSAKSIAIADKIRTYYFCGKPIRSAIPELIDLLSDLNIIGNIHATIKTHGKLSNTIYFYKFSYEGEQNISKRGNSHVKGASHGDELLYLFKPKYEGATTEDESADDKMREKIVRMWTNFAKTGNPTPDANDELLPDKWKPLNLAEMNYLDIRGDGCVEMNVHPLKDRMAFWDEIEKMAFESKVKIAKQYVARSAKTIKQNNKFVFATDILF